MGYKEKICPICGLTYRGWHNASCCSKPGCYRLWRKINWHKPPEQVKICRKCKAVIPKRKQLCEKCRKHLSHFVCVACGKIVHKKEEGQKFCVECYRKLSSKEEISKMLLQIQQDTLLIKNYESMFQSQQNQIVELLQRNQELRKEKQWLERKIELLEVEKDAEFNRSASIGPDEYSSKSNRLEKLATLRDF